MKEKRKRINTAVDASVYDAARLLTPNRVRWARPVIEPALKLAIMIGSIEKVKKFTSLGKERINEIIELNINNDSID